MIVLRHRAMWSAVREGNTLSDRTPWAIATVRRGGNVYVLFNLPSLCIFKSDDIISEIYRFHIVLEWTTYILPFLLRCIYFFVSSVAEFFQCTGLQRR